MTQALERRQILQGAAGLVVALTGAVPLVGGTAHAMKLETDLDTNYEPSGKGIVQ